MARNPLPTALDRLSTLTALPTGILLEFQITALNEAGESVPGAVSSITLS